VFVESYDDSEGVIGSVSVAGETPLFIGFGESALVVQRAGGETLSAWPLDAGDRRPDAMRALLVPGKGVGIVYRHGLTIWLGWLTPEGEVLRAAEALPGTGRRVGKPMLASDGKRAIVVFANEPDIDDAIKEIRWAHGDVGTAFADTQPVALPEGGPGGDAIAPAIASLADGRWILMWTEGQRGARVLRAQTYDGAFRHLGRALRVSPATGNFGQGTVGVVANNAVIAFLLAAGRRRYELWGTVLQCD
jgi:hypothetical protein